MDKSYANVELYQVLGLDFGADEKQVAKAYKKKSLQHHPDRGGDGEGAKPLVETDLLNQRNEWNKELTRMTISCVVYGCPCFLYRDDSSVAKFLELKHARDVLLDPKKKKEYDQKVSQEILARKKQRERDAELDAKRRQMRNELLRKEQDAESERQRKTPMTQRNDLNRMREKALAKQRELEEKMALQHLRRQAKAREQQREADFESRKSQRTVTFKWNRKRFSHSDETLASLLRDYGVVESIKLKSASAKVVFQKESAAAQAVRMEGHKEKWREVSLKGHIIDSDTFDAVSRDQTTSTAGSRADAKVYLPTGPVSLEEHLDFEEFVLNKLRSAVKGKTEASTMNERVPVPSIARASA